MLQLEQFGLRLDGRQLIAGLDLSIGKGRVLGLVGESGSGKTLTALSCIRLEPAGAELQGSIRCAGRELLGAPESELMPVRGRVIGMVFQDAQGSLHPTRTLGAQIAALLRQHHGASRSAARAGSLDWLRRVGLDPALAGAFAHQVSGGQAQRAALALALACGPRLLICDEPTSALDVSTQRQVMELLAELKRELELSLLFISHDLALAAEYCDEIAVLRRGELAEVQAADQLWQAPRSSYGIALLRCRPTLEAPPERLPMIGADGTLVPGETRPRSRPADTAVLLEVEQLQFAYPRRGLARWFQPPVPALHQLSFQLRRGHTLGVVGESGSGKTTLAHCLIRLLEPGGHIRFDGLDLLKLRGAALRSFRRRMQMVFQNPFTALNPALTIERQLLEPLLIHGLGGSSASERHARLVQLLEEVGLEASALPRRPAEFSGGQLQRIAIARALACEPELLICDESVSALDVSVQAQVLNLLADLRDRRGLSLIFVSHDLAVIRFIADEVLVLESGQAVELAHADALFARPQHPYTRALLDAVPKGPPLPR